MAESMTADERRYTAIGLGVPEDTPEEGLRWLADETARQQNDPFDGQGDRPAVDLTARTT